MTATWLEPAHPPAAAGERVGVALPSAPSGGRRHRSALVAAALLVVVGVAVSANRPALPPTCGTLAGRAVSDLRTFTSWLDEHHVEGVVGEVGWPTSSARAWEPVATPWLATAVDRGVGVYVWGAAEQWPPDYPLGVYRNTPDGTFTTGSQAALVERMLSPSASGSGAAALRGVALSGPSFAAAVDDEASPYSSTRPGTRGVDYQYPSWRFLVRLSERGITSVRLAVMWERLQPRLGGALDPGELGEVRRVLQSAEQLGMTVVIDLHNYGRYAEGDGAGGRRVLRVGDDALSASALGDLWRRLAAALRGSPALAAYGLMNEPHDLPGGAARWEGTTREVVADIRTVDPSTLVLVPGYGWSSAAAWRQNHASPWVHDAHVGYEAHQYFDSDRSGRYALPVAEEAALASVAPCAQR